jgi:hypothetical protein
MRAPQDTSFEDRLGHWIAAQGFWFQLRHSTGKSGAAKLGNRLLHLGIRLLVILLLVAAGIGVYLVKRVDSREFKEGLHDSAAAALGAESAEVTGFERERGKVYVHRLTAEGSTESFFTKIEARGVRYKMGLFDGLLGEWDAGPVTVAAARIEAKAGASDEEELAAISENLFGQHDWFKFPMVEVLDATVLWGYSARTRGMVQGSHLIVQRLSDGWRLEFRGGRFSQNWLSRLEIDELVVKVVPGELIIESARFRRDGGSMILTGRALSGLRPSVEAKAQFDSLPVRPLLPPEARPFIEGTISGEATLAGSTNSQEGVSFDGRIVLGSTDQVVLRDRLPLLQALTVVDIYNSYRKVPFTIGSFRLKTGAGKMSVSELELEASDLAMLSGEMTVRQPTDEEVARSLTDGPQGGDSSVLQSIFDDMDDASSEGDDEEETFTLRRAAEAANREEKESASETMPGFGRLSLMPMSIQEQARNRYARMMRFEGGFMLEIAGDAFERAQALREIHTKDPVTNRIPLEVPLSGTLFELTLDQAENLYLKGKRVD